MQPGTTTPEAAQMVTLVGHRVGERGAAIATTATAGDGSYSFSVSPTANTVYHVKTIPLSNQQSADLFQGVADAVSLSAGASSVELGQTVTLSGEVIPDHVGHAVELEQLGSDGSYHVVATALVTPASTYFFSWSPGNAGSSTLRVRILGGPLNVGATTAPLSISVDIPPLDSLPTAS
jgi:hypothetical protein